MTAKALHAVSGIFLISFVGLHLFNHLCSIFGADEHITVMNLLRKLYRNPFIEILLLTGIAIQSITGVKLFINKRSIVKNRLEKLQLWSGLYLLVFLFMHLGAVFAARLFLHMDTNFYFGVAGINTFPYSLFFIPYYALAVISFFGHIAAIHAKKMKWIVLGMTPGNQAIVIIIGGLVITIILFYGCTNQFRGLGIPHPYNTLFK